MLLQLLSSIPMLMWVELISRKYFLQNSLVLFNVAALMVNKYYSLLLRGTHYHNTMYCCWLINSIFSRNCSCPSSSISVSWSADHEWLLSAWHFKPRFIGGTNTKTDTHHPSSFRHVPLKNPQLIIYRASCYLHKCTTILSGTLEMWLHIKCKSSGIIMTWNNNWIPPFQGHEI